MNEHHLSPTTHTTELEQIHEINAALAGGHRVTAGSSGVATVPEGAVLRCLEAAGPPSYPYVFGRFRRRDTGEVVRVALHTAQLRAISNQLSLRWHVWGIGRPALSVEPRR